MRRILGTTTAVALLLALPACGTKTDETARAAGITPANALGFLSVSLDPSIEQKRNLLGIARRFPDAEVKDDFEENRDDLLSSILEEAGLDYEKDVKPWLGSEIAVAVLPGTPSPEPQVAVLIEQDDEEQAKAAIDKANAEAEAEGAPPIAYKVVDDFVVATDGSDAAAAERTLDAFAAQEADENDLSRSKEFAEVVDELHGDRLLLAWVDGKDALAALEPFLEGNGIPIDALGEQAVATAFDVHAADSALVMEAVARSTEEATDGKPELTEGLPSGSLGALTVFDVSKILRDALAVAATGNPFEEFTEETGLDLEADLLSWMGGEAVLVAAPVAAGGGESTFPSVGLVVEPTDRAKAEAALPKIQQAIAGLGDPLRGVQPAAGLFEDRFVVASSPAFLEELSKDASPSFGENDAYRSVLGESSSDATRMQLVLDLDAIRETVETFFMDAERAAYEREVKPKVEPLDALGFVVHREGAFDRVELKLTFD